MSESTALAAVEEAARKACGGTGEEGLVFCGGSEYEPGTCGKCAGTGKKGGRG